MLRVNIDISIKILSGKSATIRESNHGSGVCKEHYPQYYAPKSSILLAATDVWKISYVAYGYSSIKIDLSDYPKSLFSRINEVYVFFIKYRYSDILLKKKHKLHLSRLFCCNHTCYCFNMVSVTSASRFIMLASRYITSESRYHLCFQSRSTMYIHCLIPQNWSRQFRLYQDLFLFL